MKKIVIFFLLILLIYSVFSVIAFAQFETEELTEQETHNFNFSIERITDEPKDLSLNRFAVSEEGKIALGFYNSPIACVSLYDSTGAFLYGYRFDIDGTFGLGFEKENLLIYLVRSHIAVTVNSDGEIIKAMKIKDSLKNTQYWNDEVDKTTCEIDNKKYIMDSKFSLLTVLSFSYSRFRVLDGETELVVYDASISQFYKAIIVAIIVISAITIALVIVVKALKQKSKVL